ncbi:PDR/VanB family oxidoreductase [Pseudomonas sp. NPDC096950]|uniref:PDR/VanB family oxidoreductase n=1 Tax=Pseudomonas sp. NPDC096950 TaxID=3364485 RepID=UPI00383B0EEB
MIEVKVLARTSEALDICSFELAPLDTQPLPAFSAGAHIDVHLSNGVVRQYSLCNASDERHRYVISVLREPNSRGGSRQLHEQINVGDRLNISAPRNLFELEPNGKKYLLFAGGIGITPILCMAQQLAREGADFELHYCSRSESRAAYVDWLKNSTFANRVHLHFDDGPVQLKLDANAVMAHPEVGTHLYVCGPGGFMDYVLDTARSCGWPQTQVHREYFAAPIVAHGADETFEVEIASSGDVYQIPPDKSVFEVLDAAGVEIPLSCAQGVCGSCVTGVLAGEPDHRDQFLNADERLRNDKFTPCCSRAKSPRLVLDL